MKHPAIAAALVSITFLLSACATVSAPPAVPPLRSEIIPNPPVSAIPLIWQPGHWDWTGSGYAWQPGEYIPQGTHSNMFMPGYWQQTSAGWSWIPAHWL